MSIKQAIEALPPLPSRMIAYDTFHQQLEAYTAEQMREYALAALRSMPQGEPTNIKDRWNIERDGDDLLVCFNDHDKGDKCEYRRYMPSPATPHTEAVRMSEAEILRDQDIEDWISTIATVNCWGVNMSREQAFRFARAVEQATAARLGVKMGDV